jgi:hypothetical protein
MVRARGELRHINGAMLQHERAMVMILRVGWQIDMRRLKLCNPTVIQAICMQAPRTRLVCFHFLEGHTLRSE